MTTRPCPLSLSLSRRTPSPALRASCPTCRRAPAHPILGTGFLHWRHPRRSATCPRATPNRLSGPRRSGWSVGRLAGSGRATAIRLPFTVDFQQVLLPGGCQERHERPRGLANGNGVLLEPGLGQSGPTRRRPRAFSMTGDADLATSLLGGRRIPQTPVGVQAGGWGGSGSAVAWEGFGPRASASGVRASGRGVASAAGFWEREQES
jgi:hypothetical protein